MKDLSPATRAILLIGAGVILAAAVFWFVLLESNTYTKAACDRINSFGYRSAPSQLRICYHGENTSIRDFGEFDFTKLVPLSESCGFGSDIDKVGSVELYSYQVDSDRSISIWFVDKQPELVYLYAASADEFYPIDRK